MEYYVRMVNFVCVLRAVSRHAESVRKSLLMHKMTSIHIDAMLTSGTNLGATFKIKKRSGRLVKALK